MRQIWSLAVLAAAVAASSGCTKPAVREKPLSDPLLTLKRPVEGKQHLSVAGRPADDLPIPPPPPSDLYQPVSRPVFRMQGER